MVAKVKFLLVLFLFCSASLAQIDSDLDFIINHNSLKQIQSENKVYHLFTETSEIKIFCMGMIRFYQKFISSQQNGRKVCVFTPSCSHFGLSAIMKYGTVFGVLMTSDRLQRCNGLSEKFYQTNHSTGKLSDPVEPYYMCFWGK